MKSIYTLLFCFYVSSIFAQVRKPNEADAGPLARMEYELMRSIDPQTGELPPNIRQREFDFTSKLPSYKPTTSLKGHRTLGADWQPVGPTNQPGRIRAFAIDIDNRQNFLAGSASGGVWRSIDRGASWVKVTPMNEVQDISSIVQDKRPGKRTTWYYGTSELLSTTNRRHTTNIRTHTFGNGIYRSTDNGTSWLPIPSTQSRDGSSVPVQFQGVWNLVLDHTSDQDIIYAACYGGIMRSSDGGASWALVLGSDTDHCFNSDIVIATNGTLYAGLSSSYSGVASPKQGVWKSTDGINWQKINDAKLPNLFRRIKLATAPVDDNILYAFSEAPSSWAEPDATFGSIAEMLRYDGNTWKSHDLPNSGMYFTLTGYCMSLVVHPTNSDLVFFAGNDAYRSTDGLKNFEWIGGYTDTGWALHPDIHALLIDPHDPTTLFAATDGGIYSTSDYLSAFPNWTSYHSGLGTSQIYDVKIDNETSGSGLIVCGLQDNNSYATIDANKLWEITSGGDGMTSGVVDGSNLFITSYQGGYALFFGYDGETLNYYGYGHPVGSLEQFTFFTRYLVEPVSKLVLFMPEWSDLWRLDYLQSIDDVQAVDNEYSWSQYTNVGSAIQSPITALAASESLDQKLYLGARNGHIYMIDQIDNLQVVPLDITSPTFPLGGFPAHIEVDPYNDDNIFVVFSNYNTQSIFHTTNGGLTWEPVSGNLEQNPDGSGAGPSIRSVRILHTANSTNYYAATTSGLFSTDKLDGMNTTWVREGATTIGNLIVENIDVRESDGWIVCATQGGGIFANTPSSSVERDNDFRQYNLIVEQNYPNPMRNTSDIRFRLKQASHVVIELFDVRGKKIKTLSDTNYSAGDHQLTLSLSELADGKYFYRFTTGNENITKMLTVLR